MGVTYPDRLTTNGLSLPKRSASSPPKREGGSGGDALLALCPQELPEVGDGEPHDAALLGEHQTLLDQAVPCR